MDSGTTLTYIPFLLYANLWTAILKTLALARKQAIRRRLMENDLDTDETIIRVSGTSIVGMKEKLKIYIDRLKAERRKETEQIGRQMKENKKNDFEKFYDEEILNDVEKESRIQRELKLAESLKFDVEELELEQNQYLSYIDHRALNELSTIKNNQSAIPRILDESLNKNRYLFPDDVFTSLLRMNQEDPNESIFHVNMEYDSNSASPLRRLVPVSVPNLDEECWYLSNGEADLR